MRQDSEGWERMAGQRGKRGSKTRGPRDRSGAIGLTKRAEGQRVWGAGGAEGQEGLQPNTGRDGEAMGLNWPRSGARV